MVWKGPFFWIFIFISFFIFYFLIFFMKLFYLNGWYSTYCLMMACEVKKIKKTHSSINSLVLEHPYEWTEFKYGLRFAWLGSVQKYFGIRIPVFDIIYMYIYIYEWTAMIEVKIYIYSGSIGVCWFKKNTLHY